MTEQELADLHRRLNAVTQRNRPHEIRRRIQAIKAAEFNAQDRGAIAALESLIEGIEAITDDESVDPHTAATIAAIARAVIKMIEDGNT